MGREPSWSYTDAEVKMFNALGVHDLTIYQSLPPPRIYTLIAQDCFISNLQGPAVDALRRGLKALNAGEKRSCEEFDKLISFES